QISNSDLPMAEFGVILPAAGTSSRFGGPKSKLMELLEGKAVLARSVRAFLARTDVKSVVIPTHGATDLLAEPALREELSDPRVHVCLGGESRAHSVRNALLLIPAVLEWVAVHDAARPLISQSLIDSTLAAAERYGAAAPG